jgi:potassium-transporting ATPase KdpC subunit
MKQLLSEIRTSLVAVLALAVLLCGIYPLVVWGIGQTLFPNQANGSLIVKNGKVIGSELIAQNFTSPKYFHPRPSAAGDMGYDASSSGGSNLGPTSRKLMDAVKERVEAYRTENGLSPTASIPVDAVTASASGLDPDISISNALLQAPRVAKARGVSERAVKRKIEELTEGRDLGVFGEKRLNVLKLNLALDKIL